MGASVAYFLARRGVAVTVVERLGVACAASGKSGGFLALDWCDGSLLAPLPAALVKDLVVGKATATALPLVSPSRAGRL